MPFGMIVLLIILLLGSIWSVNKKKLTIGGAIAGSIIAILIFSGTGFTGLTLMIAFFVLAVLAGVISKKRMGIQADEQRNAKQVIANSGLAALCAISAYFDPLFAEQYTLMIAGCFSAATSDTLSSEEGNAYGSNFFDLRTLKKGNRGENGVVSFEGSIAGVIGAAVIAWTYFSMTGNPEKFLLIMAAGIIGNFVDSLLGAFPERNNLIGNNMVNLLNTFSAILFVAIFG